MKLKIGDTIKVTRGKDRGKEGKIERVLPAQAQVVIAGINLHRRHVKAKSGRPGEIAQIAVPLPFANVTLICPQCHHPTRVGFSLDKTGKKIRLCKKCGAPI